MCHAQDHFIFSHFLTNHPNFLYKYIADYVYALCPNPDPDIGPSAYVLPCAAESVFCACVSCVVSAQGLCTINHSWQHTGCVHLDFQAGGNVDFEDTPLFGVCRPACHDSLLYLRLRSLEDVVLPK